MCQAPSTRPGPALVIPPDKVKEVSLGKPGFQRRALMMVTEEVPADYLFIGEAIVPPANWASFPPHRHDFDDLPYEVDMEEIYYFRFDRPQGFGIQKIYTDNRSIDETLHGPGPPHGADPRRLSSRGHGPGLLDVLSVDHGGQEPPVPVPAGSRSPLGRRPPLGRGRG